LLLCDEASAGLDPQIRAELIDHVRRLCSDTGMAVLWTTHLLDELPFADRIIHLAAGQALEEPEFSVAGAFQRASR
jgi:ABC-2 type transport system ATP-binding protein